MSIDDLNGGANNQLSNWSREQVVTTTNKVSNSIWGIDNLPGLEKFKSMLTLQPAIAWHHLDTEIEWKKIYAHLAVFRNYLLSPEFVDRVSKINGSFENFVTKLNMLKPQIDRVSVWSEWVVDGSQINKLITDESYNDFKNMYNSLRKLVQDPNRVLWQPKTDNFAIMLLVALRGLPMLWNAPMSISWEIYRKWDVKWRVWNLGIYAISPFTDKAKILPKNPYVSIENPESEKRELFGARDVGKIDTEDAQVLAQEWYSTKENVRCIIFERSPIEWRIRWVTDNIHYDNLAAAYLYMK